MSNDAVVYGVNPVLELLHASRRDVKRLYLLSGSKNPNLKKISELAKVKGIEIKFVSREMLGNLSRSSEHQGAVAICEPVKIYSYRYFIENQADFKRILIVNNVQDPHNLGAVLRSAYLFSFTGVILTKKNTVSITPAVIKASAGAVEYVYISVEENLPQVVIELKRAIYKIISLDMNGGIGIKGLSYDLPIALIVGGEDAGINQKLLSLSDYIVKIPIADKRFSLNLSVSAAIMMHQLYSRPE